MKNIFPIVVPKWGLEMEEGRLNGWLVEEGGRVAKGDELAEIETSKVTNRLESPYSGILRKKLAAIDRSYPCGTLIGVLAEPEVTESEIDAFVSDYRTAAVQRDESATEVRSEVLEIKGRTLRLLQLGEHPTRLLLIHGFGSGIDTWSAIQDRLAQQYSTLALDLPGHGGSSKDLAGIDSFADLAALLQEVVQSRDYAPMHIVAHSMGVSVALALAARAPDLVKTLTLISPAGLGSTPNPAFMQCLIGANSRKELGVALKMLFADQGYVTREFVDAMLKYKRLDGVGTALQKYASLLQSDSSNHADRLRGLSMPIQLIWGAQDEVIRPVEAESLPANVGLALFDSIGHVPQVEASSRTLNRILEFIGQSDRS